MNTSCDALNSEKEHKKLTQIIKYRLPHKFKKLGLLGAISIFIFLIAYKYLGSNTLLVKDVARTLMLLSLLIASLSREVFEDEYVQHVRNQSYALSFFCTLVYSISLPLIAFVLDLLITNVSGDGNVNFYDMSAFEVLFMLVCFQLLFLEALKRFGRVQ